MAGEEVTYIYQAYTSFSLKAAVSDDKLGRIGEWNGGPATFTRTTTLSETTTNSAYVSSLEDCNCVFYRQPYPARLTVTVITPTPIDTPTPTATPTFTPTAIPTPTPTPVSQCAGQWSVSKVCTIGKGQSASNNAKVSHCITGNIVNPGSIGATAHRIPVCRGTGVTAVVTDSSGSPTNTSDGSLSCSSSGCEGVVNTVEKYKAVSHDGKDTDRISLLPN
jgi:hypothetical protein